MSYKDEQGRYRTKSLFIEAIDPRVKANGYNAPFSLKADAPDGVVSMKEMYLEIADPTEYEFATQVLGSWEHWQKLCQCSWFAPHRTLWQAELEDKLRSEGVAIMREIAQSGNKGAAAAAKWLAEKGFNKEVGMRSPSKRGRPSKEEVAAERKAAVKELDETEEDAKRIGLVVNNDR